jgi:hypothetical protein
MGDDSSIGGDAEVVPIVEQEWVDSLRSAHDTTDAVRRLIAASAAILSRTTEIYEVVRRAAADPVVARLLDDTRRRRRQDPTRVDRRVGTVRTGERRPESQACR